MNKKAFIKYICSLLIFGLNGIVASHIALSSAEIVFSRTLIGGLLLTLLFLLTGGKFGIKENKKDCIFILLSGIAMGASWIFLFEAYKQIGVSLATLLYYCGPVIVMIMSPLIFKEKFTLPKVAGFITVVAGIILVNGSEVSGGGNLFGIFCGGMSAVTYFVMVTLNKKSETITGLENTVIQLAAAFLTVSVYIGFKQQFIIHIPPESIPWIIILGTVNTGAGCYLYFSSISKLPVQTVAVCSYLDLLASVVFAALLLGERMTLPQIIGAVMIIGGAMTGELINGKKANPVGRD